MPLSTFLGNELIDHVFNNAAYTSPTTVYVSLHNGDPVLTGANEITAGANSYARKALSTGVAASKAAANDALLEWLDMPAVTVSYVCVWDAVSAGNCLWVSTLMSPTVPVSAGGTFQIAIGDLDVSFT